MDARKVVDTNLVKEESYNKLAEYAEKYLDFGYMLKITNKEV